MCDVMSTIQHFSMSALADLMIVEEPDETESYLEDDEEVYPRRY